MSSLAISGFAGTGLVDDPQHRRDPPVHHGRSGREPGEQLRGGRGPRRPLLQLLTHPSGCGGPGASISSTRLSTTPFDPTVAEDRCNRYIGPRRARASDQSPIDVSGCPSRRRRRASLIVVGSPRPATRPVWLDVANVASWLRSQAPKLQPVGSGRPLTCGFAWAQSNTAGTGDAGWRGWFPLGIAASARLTRPPASRRTRSSRRQRSRGDDLEHHSLTRKWMLCEQPARTESV